MVLYDEVVDRWEVKNIISEWAEVIREFFRFKRYGAPYGRGYLEWPCVLVDVFDELSVAEAKVQEVNRRALDGRRAGRG